MGRSIKTPAYQVDFISEASGKTFGISKRRISFKFGFANPEALDKGCVGVECRGQEHEVLCIWSVTSGKRQVFLNGVEVHCSTTSKAHAKFECSFGFMSSHIMKLTAHAAPPLASNNGFAQRQFDLSLDGQSYFDFVRLFELGIAPTPVHNITEGAVVAQSSPNSAAYNNYSFAQDPNERNLSDSNGSLRSVDRYQEYDNYGGSKYDHRDSTPTAREETVVKTVEPAPEEPQVDLLDMSEEVVPATVHVTSTPSPQVAGPGEGQFFAGGSVAPTPSYAGAPSVYTSGLTHGPARIEPSPVHQSQAGYYGQQQQFEPAQSQGQQFTPYQNFQYQQTSYDVMQKYNDAPAQTNLSTEECTDIVVVSPERPSKLTMASVDVFQDEGDKDLDEVSKAMKKLCNVDRITEDSHATYVAKQAAKKETCVVKDRDGKVRSKGLAPTPTWNKGAALGEIQATKSAKQPEKPVMNSSPRSMFHPAAPQAGMMVVYGSQAPQQGPPPLQGFRAQGPQYGYNCAY